MDRIEVKYYSFNHRFWFDTGARWGLIIVVVLQLIALTRINSNLEVFFIMNGLALLILALTLIQGIWRARKYLSRLEFDDKFINVTVFIYNKQLDTFAVPLNDFEIDIKENLFDKFRRFRLELKRKSTLKNNTFDVFLKQYEIGAWTMEKQKETYKKIKDRQGKFSGTASIDRSIFGESKEQKHESITRA